MLLAPYHLIALRDHEFEFKINMYVDAGQMWTFLLLNTNCSIYIKVRVFVRKRVIWLQLRMCFGCLMMILTLLCACGNKVQ